MFFIRGLFVAKIFVVVFTAELSNNQDMVKANSIAGEHIRILAYHVSCLIVVKFPLLRYFFLLRLILE